MAAVDPNRHTRFEDAQGLFIGSSMAALGVALLQNLGLITGQVAGLALLISLWTGLAFGPVFLAINLPFYWLAWKRMGPAFVIKSMIAVALMTGLLTWKGHLITFGAVQPFAGAIMAGVVSGMGVLAVFRHGASLGGLGVVAVYLQDRTGFRAGWTQMLVDGVIFLLAVFTLPFDKVLYSLAGAATVNLVIAVNHRRDRYIGM